jgi:predicted HTH domain antitoxin
MSVTLYIPAEVVQKLAPTAEAAAARLTLEVALSLYSQGIISHFQACQLTGMGRWEFEKLLGDREVVRPYTVEMLEEDLSHVRSGS